MLLPPSVNADWRAGLTVKIGGEVVQEKCNCLVPGEREREEEEEEEEEEKEEERFKHPEE